MLKNKKILIAIIATILVLLIVLVTTIFIVIKNKNKNETENNNIVEEKIDKEKLETDFKQPFLNEETEYVKIRTNVEKSIVGKYDVQAYIPKIDIEGEEAENINNEIYRLAANIINEAAKVEKYSKYDMEYTSFVNNDILSLVVRFTVKEEDNPRRIIIKTYNYDLKEDKQIKLSNITNKDQRSEIEKAIMDKIEEENKLAEKTISLGYNAYVRDTKNSIYKIENATEFFIGNDNILYIVYAYGNQDYTDIVDLIMYKL